MEEEAMVAEIPGGEVIGELDSEEVEEEEVVGGDLSNIVQFLFKEGIVKDETSAGEIARKLYQHKGVDDLEGLAYLKEKNLEDEKLGLTEVQVMKIIAKAAKYKIPENSTSILDDDDVLLETSSMSSMSSVFSFSNTQQRSKLIKIRYVCFKKFTEQQNEESIEVDLYQNTLRDLTEQIKVKLHLDPAKNDVVLYRSEGYPLSPSQSAMEETLKRWCFSDMDLLYVFITNMSACKTTEESSIEDETTVDINRGPHKLMVYYPHQPPFEVRIDLANDSIETLKKKIHATGKTCSPSMMKIRKGKKEIENLNSLKHRDVVFVTWELSVTGQLQNFDSSKYEPLVSQSNRGLNKFYALLWAMTLKMSSYGKENFYSHIMNKTNCPPLAHSLKLVLETEIISPGCRVALVEGCFQLFQALLNNCYNVADYQIFEFSDYLLAHLIAQSEYTADDNLSQYPVQHGSRQTSKPKMLYQIYDLCCSITNLPMTKPVTINIGENDEVFDSTSLQLVRKGHLIDPRFQPHTALDIRPNLEYEKIVLSHYPAKSVQIWQCTTAMSTYKIPPVHHLSCTTNELEMILEASYELRVKDPAGFNEDSCESTLTHTDAGMLICRLSRGKFELDSEKLFDPSTGQTKVVNAEVLSKYAKGKDKYQMKIGRYATRSARVQQSSFFSRWFSFKRKTCPPKGIKEVFVPDEAIMVLFDASSSMKKAIYSTEKNMQKVHAAREMFLAYSNRSQAYGLKHCIGLITFQTTYKLVLPMTSNFSKFKESIDNVQCGGRTSLYDAMIAAQKELAVIKKDHPECKCRIMCLSDGCDNQSTTSVAQVVHILQESEIVVDSVLIQNHPDNIILKAISHATGGTCFLPTDQVEGHKIFEAEPVLSLRARDIKQQLPKEPYTAFMDKVKYPFDQFETLPIIVPEIVKTASTISAERFMQKSKLQYMKPSQPKQTNRVRRLLSEIKEIQRETNEDLQVYPCEDNIGVWKILLRAPSSTPYEGGCYMLYAVFPEEYPIKPPLIRFQTKIYHCNINSCGRICHSILSENYSPNLAVYWILCCIYSLLMAPQPDDPLDSVLAEEFFTNQAEYDRKAKEHTQKHAIKSWEALKKECSGGDAYLLTCPLTKKIFTNPYTTKYGNTYEYTALVEHIANHGEDYVAKKPLTLDDIFPNHSLLAIVSALKSSD